MQLTWNLDLRTLDPTRLKKWVAIEKSGSYVKTANCDFILILPLFATFWLAAPRKPDSGGIRYRALRSKFIFKKCRRWKSLGVAGVGKFKYLSVFPLISGLRKNNSLKKYTWIVPDRNNASPWAEPHETFQ